MLFNTLVLVTLAYTVTAAKAADSCAAGSVLGIYAMCGTFPVDCGKGLCCLQGQKCVTGGCTDPKLVDDGGKVLTVSAACYGQLYDHQEPPSTKITSAPASFVANPSTIPTPSSTPKNIDQSAGAGGTSGPKATLSSPPYTYTNGTGQAPETGIAGKGASPTGTAAGSSTSSPAMSNSGSYTSPQNAAALLLSGVAVVALWL